jgi:hypothetical protein
MSSGRPRVAGTAHLRNIGPTPQVTPAQTRYKLWEVSNRRMRYRMADRNPSRGRRLQVAMQDSVMHYSRGMFITQARTGAAALRRPPSNNPPGGIYPCKPGGPNDYVYLLTSPSYSPRWLRAAGSPGVGIGASLTVAHVSLLDMIGLVGAGG